MVVFYEKIYQLEADPADQFHPRLIEEDVPGHPNPVSFRELP
jgi:hypothetical protein